MFSHDVCSLNRIHLNAGESLIQNFADHLDRTEERFFWTAQVEIFALSAQVEIQLGFSIRQVLCSVYNIVKSCRWIEIGI